MPKIVKPPPPPEPSVDSLLLQATVPGVQSGPRHPHYHSCWFWCTKHNRAELGAWAVDGCRRIGPFADEDEIQDVGLEMCAPF